MREDLPPGEELLQPGCAVSRACRAVRRFTILVALFGWVCSFHPASAARAQVGTPVADVELATLEGGKYRVLGDAAASVLVFFRPGQERSLEALKGLADCQRAFAGKPVRWVAIVSSGASRDSVAAVVRETRLAMPVLVDEGDALYGSLGVALHPVIVIVGADRRLAAFEPFRAINYCAVVTARIRHVLREISDEELQRALAPPVAVNGGDAQTAGRNLRLAEALFKAKNYVKALESVRRSLEKDPALAPAHALMGDILAAQGNWAEARAAYRKAREIDPSNRTAIEGVKR